VSEASLRMVTYSVQTTQLLLRLSYNDQTVIACTAHAKANGLPELDLLRALVEALASDKAQYRRRALNAEMHVPR
jgi:hypothetical protein